MLIFLAIMGFLFVGTIMFILGCELKLAMNEITRNDRGIRK